MGSDAEGTGYSPEIREKMKMASKRNYPLNEDECWMHNQKDPLFHPEALRQAYEDYVQQYPSVRESITIFYDYLLRQCKPEEKEGSVTIRALTSWQRERLKELIMTSEVTQVGRADESGVLIVEYDSNPFNENSEIKIVQINRFP